MADPEGIMPYYDLFEGQFTDNLTNIMNDYANPSLLDLATEDTNGQVPSSHNSDYINSVDAVQDISHIPSLEDSWGLLSDPNFDGGGAFNQPGPSVIHDHQENNDHQHHQQEQQVQHNLELPQVNPTNTTTDGNSRPLSTWPSPPVPFNCSCCQVLREIIHVNDYNNYMKLEIHGRLGIICHAIFERKSSTNVNNNNTNSGASQFEMLDFCRQSTEEVKRFLAEYCSQRKVEGYVMMHDPLSLFYKALCVGLDCDDDILPNDDFVPTSPLNSGRANQEENAAQQEQEDQPPVTQGEVERIPRTSLAAQRQRTGRLTLMDLREYLHLPIEKAARGMNVCPTVLKKICRKSGLPRWPYRKIRSIQRQISGLRPSLNSNDAQTREQAQAEIDRLRQEVTNICAGVNILGL